LLILVRGAADIKEFIALLHQPRAVMMLVPTDPPVDSVISTYERIDAKGLHVIRITSKGAVSPTPIERIALRMTQTAQSRKS
jgi:hypothetical protein